MNDRIRVTLCAGAGAILGAAAGYLFWTDGGRELRRDIEPRLDELVGEAQRLGGAFERTRRAVEEGWRSFNQLVQEERGGENWKTH